MIAHGIPMSLGGLVDKILATDPVVTGLIPAMEHLFFLFSCSFFDHTHMHICVFDVQRVNYNHTHGQMLFKLTATTTSEVTKVSRMLVHSLSHYGMLKALLDALCCHSKGTLSSNLTGASELTFLLNHRQMKITLGFLVYIASFNTSQKHISCKPFELCVPTRLKSHPQRFMANLIWYVGYTMFNTSYSNSYLLV